MAQERADMALARLARSQFGAFSRDQARAKGLTEKQIQHRIRSGLWTRVLPGVYRDEATPLTEELTSTAALLWAGDDAVITDASAARVWSFADIELPGVGIVVPRRVRIRSNALVRVRHSDDRAALQVCRRNGFPVTSVAATLVALSPLVDPTALEAAFESARRQRLVTISSVRRYLEVHGRSGVRGTASMRALLEAVDPSAPSRSTLEVLTRELLVAHGVTDFVREYAMKWNGRTYYFDFAFPRQRVILETNGRRWHDDAADYEHDNEKWSVPGRLGWRIVFATWDKVMHDPACLLEELRAALAA